MTLNDYQKQAEKYATYPRDGIVGMNEYFEVASYPLLGLAEEVGELLGKIAKIKRDKKGVLDDTDRQEIIKEIGDCLWMLSAIASEMQVNLLTVAFENLEKLESRKQRGVIGGSGDNR